jgi:hypothetical protein
VGIPRDGMGMLTLDPLWKEMRLLTTFPILRIMDALGMGGVGLIPLIEGKEDTIEVPPMVSDG